MAPLGTDQTTTARISVEELTEFGNGDLHDLCDAAEAAIREGGGFGWLAPPPRPIMEAYWRGVLLVPERTLFVGRLDGVIAGSAQLVRPPRNNEAQAHAAQMTTNFVAPWARGHGLAKAIALAVEDAARRAGFATLNLDVRETQDRAIRLYRSLGYRQWGTHPQYARVDGRMLAGLFFWKELNGADKDPEGETG
jgi:ribosomal protein S18 acetylase RimI-like enzyme